MRLSNLLRKVSGPAFGITRENGKVVTANPPETGRTFLPFFKTINIDVVIFHIYYGGNVCAGVAL